MPLSDTSNSYHMSTRIVPDLLHEAEWACYNLLVVVNFHGIVKVTVLPRHPGVVSVLY